MKKIYFHRFFMSALIAVMGMIPFAMANADPGTTGLTFLKFGDGARAVGMGEAQTGLAEGVNAVYWNPAGLGVSSSKEVTMTQLQYFENASEQYAAFALPLRKGRSGTLGFSASKFSITNIEGRDASSTLTSNNLSQDDLSLQLSYGIRVGGADRGLSRDGLCLGFGAKRISEKLPGVAASATAFDLGGQYRPTEGVSSSLGEWTRRLSLGASVVNLGKGPTFDQEETPLPRATRVGLGYTHFLWGDAFNLAADAELPRGGGAKFSGGGEFWIKNTLALRAGYVQGQDVGDAVRVGAGFRFQTLQIDDAFARYGDVFGNAHRFTLTWRFGEGALKAQGGLQTDLVAYHLSQAEDDLSAGSFYEAVIEANRVLDLDPRNPQALQILVEAGEKMKPADSLPPAIPVKEEKK